MGIQINGNTDIISATDGSLTIQGASGNLTGNLTGTATTAQGLTGTPNITVGTIGATSLNASGVVTATSFSGSGANLTGIGGTTDVRTNSLVVSGVSTVTDLRVGTAVTANSNGIQVGAGKSVRIFGSTSGFSDIIASSAAGASELLLPNTSGTLDRLNRAGNVLQVVENNSSTIQTNLTTTFASLITASITPSATSNKILICCLASLEVTANTNSYGQIGVYRGTTSGTQLVIPNGGINSGTASSWSFNVCWLDSPATISSQTYTLAFRKGSINTTSVATNGFYNIVLLEIAA